MQLVELQFKLVANLNDPFHCHNMTLNKYDVKTILISILIKRKVSASVDIENLCTIDSVMRPNRRLVLIIYESWYQIL